MKVKNFYFVMIFVFSIFAVIILGGCGGGSGSIDDNAETSARYALLGSLDGEVYNGSDLTPYIKKLINKKIDPLKS